MPFTPKMLPARMRNDAILIYQNIVWITKVIINALMENGNVWVSWGPFLQFVFYGFKHLNSLIVLLSNYYDNLRKVAAVLDPLLRISKTKCQFRKKKLTATYTVKHPFVRSLVRHLFVRFSARNEVLQTEFHRLIFSTFREIINNFFCSQSWILDNSVNLSTFVNIFIGVLHKKIIACVLL